MIYWLPLRERGVKRLLLSVKMHVMGIMWMAMEASGGIGASGIDVGVSGGGCVKRMCCWVCAMCPMLVLSASGQ